jgi:hypothetical protein
MFIRKALNSLIVVALLATACSLTAAGQTKGTAQHKRDNADTLASARANLLKATNEYKESLEKLASIYERNLKEDRDRLDQLKELYSRGILSKRELDEAERKVAAAQASLESSRKQIAQADDMIAESSAMEPDDGVATRGKLISTPAYMRFNGAARWSLQDSASVGSFFLKKFGRPMPISAYGQTGVHDRLHFDHRNSVDVAVSPDSVEGQALMTYLRQVGIPFIAFRRAVAGSATGAHIHIGYPSHRLASSDSAH